MKAPIKYFGGKNEMAHRIIKYFPDDKNIKNYIEPYGGSAALLFHLSESYSVEVYNDLDNNVYSLFKVLVNEDLFKEFKRRCDLALFSEKLNKEYKERLRSEELSLIDRAFMFYYVNRSSYNGVGSFSTSTVIRRGMSKQVSDFLSSIDRLYEIHNRLSKVSVFNRDAVSVIEKFDKENTIMYLDPPYVHNTRSSARYGVDMDDGKHLELIDCLLKIQKSFVILSGYDNEIYDRLLEKGWNKYSFDVKTQSGNRKSKVKQECLWVNY